MIVKVKELISIAIYLHTNDIYKNELMYSSQRFCNNSEHEFTDPEVMTIYLYLMTIEKRLKLNKFMDITVYWTQCPLLPVPESAKAK